MADQQAQESSISDTAHEVRFIKFLGMGKWSQSKAVAAAGREQMLRRYQVACLGRSNWGKIDRGKVMEAVERELMEFQR